MNWLDKVKGKIGQPDSPAGGSGDKLRQRPDREAGGTVVRAGAKPARTLAKPGIRFQPNHDVTADLQIKKLLGSGAMGEVYLARQRLWDVDVALKIPNDEILSDPENRHRIVREAEYWTDLGLHPNIAYCYYAQPLGELLLLVIEYADGGNLRDWIKEGRCADLRTGLDLAIQFCHGLEHAHKKGMVHRDIKPENVLLMLDGTLKLTDFGIVHKALASPKILESTGAVRRMAAGMTTAGIGTPDYMAPEQWGGQGEIDLRADIFAFGVCLYEMLCGARPYLGDMATAGQRQDAPEPARMRGGKGLPERLSGLMKKCVDWDRENRPAGTGEVLEELCAVYEKQFGEPCLHAELPELTSQADDWNNRGLSHMALGRAEDAEKAWQTALEADSRHPESTYNYGLLRWREAKITDQEILADMRGVAESDRTSWLPRYLLVQLHLERGDAEGAREELAKIQGDEAAREEVAAVRRALEELPAPTRLVPGCKLQTGHVGDAVCLSGDGRYALSGGFIYSHAVRLSEIETGRVRFFEGHALRVKSVCLSADGRYALSGSADKTLKLWEVESGRCLRTFEGHTDQVESVCLSADGQYAVSGSADKTLKLWEVESGRCLRTFEEHTSRVASVCLSADGRYALSGSYDTPRLWDVESGRCLRKFEGHRHFATSMSLSANGRYALSGSYDKTLKLWEVENGRCLRSFQGHTDYVESVCLSHDGQFALSASRDETIKLWEVKSGRCLRTFDGHTIELCQIGSVCLSADGRFALSGGAHPRLWEIGKFQYRASYRLGRLTASAESIGAAVRYAAALSEARNASGAGDAVRVCQCLRRARQELRHRRATSAVREWGGLYVKLRRGRLADCWLLWQSANTNVRVVSLSADGRFALSGSHVSLELWEVNSGRCLRTFVGNANISCSAGLSADGRRALTGGSDGTLKLWEVENGRFLNAFAHRDYIKSVCLSSDGGYALSGGGKTLKLWDVKSGRCLRTIEAHAIAVESVCLSADGEYALSGGYDGSLKLWEVKNGRSLRDFITYPHNVSSVCLSADGRYALSGSKDKTLKLWELKSGNCLRTFEGHTHNVNSVCLTADGKHALSGSADKTLKLWEVASGRCLRTLEHYADVISVALSADGRLALSVCESGTVTAWFLDWDLEENEPSEWDEGARPYLDVFLRAHQPYAATLPTDRQPTDAEVTHALTRRGQPTWSEDDFKGLLYTLGCAGYGWLRAEGVRCELERMRTALDDAQNQNLSRWQQSGVPKRWVIEHHCQWNHVEWCRLLDELATSEFWPMDPDRVGLVLEAHKRSIQKSDGA